ncbi:cell wall hydrolase [Sphingomonas gei]|uniref:Cell wall hydrolase n=1 Tax=Sphingomonas gei TaxID=1395960 RepID=A0A4S1WZC8_9SPHN|nr:cell wall hydrolase [Sphingomonas gei]TGX48703.1 cell wall hydrolase [Sphingomonas gei]
MIRRNNLFCRYSSNTTWHRNFTLGLQTEYPDYYQFFVQTRLCYAVMFAFIIGNREYSVRAAKISRRIASREVQVFDCRQPVGIAHFAGSLARHPGGSGVRRKGPFQSFLREARFETRGANRLGSIGRTIGAVFIAASPLAAPHAHAQSVVLPLVEDRAQAIECLTLAIAYEAGFESPEGQQAVAEVVLNRVRHRAFPKSVCGVVFAGSALKTGCQFTFTCDGSMRRRLPETVFARSRDIAAKVLDGRLPSMVGDALHYHADYVSPYWAPSLERVAKIGAHIFYRRRGAAAAGTVAVSVPDVATSAGPTLASAASASSAPAFAPWGLVPQASEATTHIEGP